MKAAPLWARAFWKRPFASGEVISMLVSMAPADWPKTVMLLTSPPKLAMLSRTQWSART